MPTPGLLYVLSKPKHPGLKEDTFNDWYSNHHIQHVVDSSLADLAIRYKNTKADAKWPYLAVYRLPDVAKMGDEKLLASIPKTHELLPEGQPWTEALETDRRALELLQKFEGQVPKEGPRGDALRTVWVEPTDNGDEEFDEWYRKQHLDMLSMVTGFRRSTRYKRVDGTPPRYVALHEYDTTNFPVEQVKLVTGTEWSKKILGAAKSFEGDVWKFITAYGQTGSKL